MTTPEPVKPESRLERAKANVRERMDAFDRGARICARDKLALELARKDRSASASTIGDLARIYRESERRMNDCVSGVVEAHITGMLTLAEQESEGR